MIEDDFFATLKLKTGEELFAKVSATDEGDRTLLLVSHPIMVETIKITFLRHISANWGHYLKFFGNFVRST